MKINSVIAKELTAKAIADTRTARLNCAYDLIHNEIEPLITKTAGDGISECTIGKELIENCHEEVVRNIVNILSEAGFEVNERAIDIIVTW